MKGKLKIDCTVNFACSLTADEVDLEVLDEDDGNQYIQLTIASAKKIGLSKVGIIVSTEDLKKILKTLDE